MSTFFFTTMVPTVFGLSLVFFLWITKNIVVGVLFAVGLSVSILVPFGATLYSISRGDSYSQLGDRCGEEYFLLDFWIGLGLGITLAFFERHTRCLIMAYFRSTLMQQKHYKHSAVPLKGSIIYKSSMDWNSNYHYLHVQYNHTETTSTSYKGTEPPSNCSELECGVARYILPTKTTATSSTAPAHFRWYGMRISYRISEQHDVDNNRRNRWTKYGDYDSSRLERAFIERTKMQFSFPVNVEMEGCVVKEFPKINDVYLKRIELKDPSSHDRKETHNRNNEARTGSNSLMAQKFVELMTLKEEDSNYLMPLSTHETYELPEKEEQRINPNMTVAAIFVGRKSYTESDIGDTIDLLYLPGNPFSVKAKSTVETPYSACEWFRLICVGLVSYPMLACWVFVLLSLYLLPMIGDWNYCERNVLVGILSMIVTASLLMISCYSCFYHSLTVGQAKRIIQNWKKQQNYQEEEQRALESLLETVDRCYGNDEKSRLPISKLELRKFLSATTSQIVASACTDMLDQTISTQTEADVENLLATLRR